MAITTSDKMKDLMNFIVLGNKKDGSGEVFYYGYDKPDDIISHIVAIANFLVENRENFIKEFNERNNAL